MTGFIGFIIIMALLSFGIYNLFAPVSIFGVKSRQFSIASFALLMALSIYIMSHLMREDDPSLGSLNLLDMLVIFAVTIGSISVVRPLEKIGIQSRKMGFAILYFSVLYGFIILGIDTSRFVISGIFSGVGFWMIFYGTFNAAFPWFFYIKSSAIGLVILLIGFLFIILSGIFSDMSLKSQIEEVLPLAENGDFKKQVLVGDLFVELKELQNAALWYEKASESDPDASYKLALLYLEDDGLELDEAKGMSLMNSAASRGSVAAQDYINELANKKRRAIAAEEESQRRAIAAEEESQRMVIAAEEERRREAIAEEERNRPRKSKKELARELQELIESYYKPRIINHITANFSVPGVTNEDLQGVAECLVEKAEDHSKKAESIIVLTSFSNMSDYEAQDFLNKNPGVAEILNEGGKSSYGKALELKEKWFKSCVSSLESKIARDKVAGAAKEIASGILSSAYDVTLKKPVCLTNCSLADAACKTKCKGIFWSDDSKRQCEFACQVDYSNCQIACGP